VRERKLSVGKVLDWARKNVLFWHNILMRGPFVFSEVRTFRQIEIGDGEGGGWFFGGVIGGVF